LSERIKNYHTVHGGMEESSGFRVQQSWRRRQRRTYVLVAANSSMNSRSFSTPATGIAL